MSQTKQRLLVNAAFGASFNLVSMVISLFMTRFLLAKLGKELYGLIPLVNGFVIFLNLFQMGTYAALGRHVTYHLVRGEEQEANEYLNTGFAVLLRLALFGLIPLAVMVVALPHIFGLPAGHQLEARMVALILGLNCLVNVAACSFGVPLYSTQRLALRYTLHTADVLVRAGLTVAAFFCIRPQVLYVALAALLASCAMHAGQYVASRLLVPSLRFTLSLFRRERMKKLLSFSVFMVIGHLGVMLFAKTDLMVVNWIYESTGPVAEYSVASRWNPMIRDLLWTVLAVVMPVVTAFEATGRIDKIRETVHRGMRYALLLAVLPCVLFPILGAQFYGTWFAGTDVAGDMVKMAPILAILVCPLLLHIATFPIAISLHGMGKVKFVAFATLGSALANLVLSLVLGGALKWGMTGVAVASAVSNVLLAVVVYPIAARRLLGLPVSQFFGTFIRPLAACAPVAVLMIWLADRVNPLGWPQLLSAYALCSMLYLVIAYLVGLQEDDRRLLGQALGLSGRGEQP